MLTLWGRASSVNVQKVLWALDELDLPCTRIDAGGRYGVVDSDAFAVMNPTRRVPVLQDGDLTLWESEAILRYLSAREWRFVPQTLPARAQADQWLAFGATAVQPPFLTLFWQHVRLAPGRRDAGVAAAARRDLTAALRVLDGQLARQDYLAGPTLGLPDIAVGALLHRIAALDLMPDDCPALDRWAAALSERPGWQRHVATSFEELRAPTHSEGA
ncbi:MAG: glutathione S-transferase [Rhodobacteraceae bacterium CG17_big_fil_post_rev_8_21_14_2_50_65_11]|nr:MAG: glutathione S-transferase [Rhodobacteraceae bacterium CG17_big_fil_post_rev_8_21_14_2_50_65_11]